MRAVWILACLWRGVAAWSSRSTSRTSRAAPSVKAASVASPLSRLSLSPPPPTPPPPPLAPVQPLAAEALSSWDADATSVSEVATQTRTLRRRLGAILPWTAKIDAEIELFMLAWLPPIVAFASWRELSKMFAYIVNELANAQNVDGNSFAVTLLRPTVSGVIVPTVSIALGTLLATTINVLRNRQVEIRASINKEACELRLLRAALLGAYGTAQHAARRGQALGLQRAYVAQLVAESTVGGFEEIERLQSRGGVSSNELERLQRMLHGVDGAVACRDSSIQSATTMIASLNGHRSDRVANLLGGFPTLHWVVLSQLSLSIILSFFFETNQDVLQFLNSLQLRTLFSMLVLVFSGTAALCVDLSDPFRGGYSIKTSVTQLIVLERTLVLDVAHADASVARAAVFGQERRRAQLESPPPPPLATEALLVAAASAGLDDDDDDDESARVDDDARRATDFDLSSDDWKLRDTVYFHLLNSAVGTQVKATGDVFAWAKRKSIGLANRTRLTSLLTKLRRPRSRLK